MRATNRPTLGCKGAECEHFKDVGKRPYCTAKRMNRLPDDFSGKTRMVDGGHYFYPEDAIKRGFCTSITDEE